MRATALRLLASLAPVASEGASICCPRAAVPLLHVSAGLHTSCYSSIGRCLPKLTQGACTPNAIYAASGAQPAIAAPAVAALARGRAFSSLPGDIQKDVDRINDMFVEARDVIEDAREDAETVYFNDSAAEAKSAVDDVLALWSDLLARCPQDQAAALQRSMGLKMEQLKAELKQLMELHAD